MTRSKQAGMDKKTTVILLLGLALASVRFAEARQQLEISGKQLNVRKLSEPDVGVSE